jgi:hypothetical protein
MIKSAVWVGRVDSDRLLEEMIDPIRANLTKPSVAAVS